MLWRRDGKWQKNIPYTLYVWVEELLGPGHFVILNRGLPNDPPTLTVRGDENFWVKIDLGWAKATCGRAEAWFSHPRVLCLNRSATLAEVQLVQQLFERASQITLGATPSPEDIDAVRASFSTALKAAPEEVPDNQKIAWNKELARREHPNDLAFELPDN